MRKYFRLLIFVVVAGLSFSLFYTALLNLSEKFRTTENHFVGRHIGKRTDLVEEEEYEEIQDVQKDEEESTKKEIRVLLRSVESEMNNRLSLVESTCKKFDLRTGSKNHPPVPQYSVFYIDRPNKFSFCPVFKAGSSTWLYNMCLLGGMTETEIENSGKQLSVLARERYPELEPEEAEEALRSTIKVMTVRHPFERLLSAYRDKLENTNYGREHGTLFFYWKFGSKIVKKYRVNGNDTKLWDILEPYQYLWNRDLPKPSGVEPTFKEFVNYLIDANLIQNSDEHWIPYYLYCTPCLLKYDVIAKIETMDQDQLYVIKLLGLEDRIKPRWRHKTQFISGNRTKDNYVSSLAKIYFQQLTVKEIEALYQKYKIDFELFGYNYEEYLQHARDYSKIERKH